VVSGVLTTCSFIDRIKVYAHAIIGPSQGYGRDVDDVILQMHYNNN
jgi:hypothetical protein